MILTGLRTYCKDPWYGGFTLLPWRLDRFKSVIYWYFRHHYCRLFDIHPCGGFMYTFRFNTVAWRKTVFLSTLVRSWHVSATWETIRLIMGNYSQKASVIMTCFYLSMFPLGIDLHFKHILIKLTCILTSKKRCEDTIFTLTGSWSISSY